MPPCWGCLRPLSLHPPPLFPSDFSSFSHVYFPPLQPVSSSQKACNSGLQQQFTCLNMLIAVFCGSFILFLNSIFDNKADLTRTYSWDWSMVVRGTQPHIKPVPTVGFFIFKQRVSLSDDVIHQDMCLLSARACTYVFTHSQILRDLSAVQSCSESRSPDVSAQRASG